MAIFTFSMIHLGNFADLDPVDGNTFAENQNDLLGTYYGPGDPAAGHIVTVTADDADGSNTIASNDTASPEAVSYDLGAGVVNTVYDSVFNANVTVTFGPASGEPPYVGLGGIIQTATGDLFLVMIDDDFGMGANSLDDFPVQSVTINSISAFGTSQSALASDDQSFVPCFTPGILIETDRGPKPVESLRPGDRIWTADDGCQPLVWVGDTGAVHTDGAGVARNAPVRIRAGALGDAEPLQDLLLSPQHRIRWTGPAGQEVLIPVGKLCGHAGIERVWPASGTRYLHFAFDRHHLVQANGCLAESLYLGRQTVRFLGAGHSRELAEVFPLMRLPAIWVPPAPVRPIIERRREIASILG